MNFQDLHELLRLELLKRIERGTLTGSQLARQTGFQQAHVSNYLNRKRSLSLEGLDRVLAAQQLAIEHILPLELAAATPTPVSDPSEIVPVVSASTAMHDPRITPSAIIETLQVSASRLRDHRARPSLRSTSWQRFVAIRVDAPQAAAMEPLLTPGATTVLDRHYNSLAPYRAQQPTLYAVRCGPSLLIRYVDLDDNCLILRPFSLRAPVQLIPLTADETPADYIVGRVCMIYAEL